MNNNNPAQGYGQIFGVAFCDAFRQIVREEVTVLLAPVMEKLTQPAEEPVPELHTVADVMARTQLSKPTIYNLIAKGSLVPVKLGRRTLIPGDQLRALMETPKVKAKNEKRGRNA